MTTYTVTGTGRTWAGQSYNRTTRCWKDGGPEVNVEIHDDDSGATLDHLGDDELISVAEVVADSEREDAGEIADSLYDEIDRRLHAMGDRIRQWDGESAGALADMLNDLDSYAERATRALRYVPGRPYGYDFMDDHYDPTSLGWHGDREPHAARNDVYASDRHGNFVVLVAGTTDDGWTTESPDETFD